MMAAVIVIAAISASPALAGRGYCLDICTRNGIAAFLRELPIVRSSASPWYPFLRGRYKSEIPLPFDLRTVGYFDFPHEPLLSLTDQRTQPRPRSNVSDMLLPTWLPPLSYCDEPGARSELSVPRTRSACASDGWIVSDGAHRLPRDLGPLVRCSMGFRGVLEGDANCEIRPWSWSEDSQQAAIRSRFLTGRLPPIALVQTIESQIVFFVPAPVARPALAMLRQSTENGVARSPLPGNLGSKCTVKVSTTTRCQNAQTRRY